ncbi:hypothetical protein ACFL6U_00315 [Planctomycetota bacterium]
MSGGKIVCLWMIYLCLGQGTGLIAKEAPKIELKQLTLVPASEPVPALKYRLLPGILEQKIGNAALFYQAAAAMCPDEEKDELRDKLNTWRDQPLDQLPLKEVEEALAEFEQSFHLLHLASLRSRCEWEMPIEDGFSMQLPSLSQYRHLVRALALRIRLQIDKKDYTAALQSLREGLAMGRSVAEGATLIQDLVGISVSAVLLKEAESLLEVTDGPNLYWALTSLPRPFIDMRPALEFEQQMIFVEFSMLADLEEEIWIVAKAQAVVAELLAKFQCLGMAQDMFWGEILTVAWVMTHYSDAKAYLADQGMAKKRIDALPAVQAVLLYQVRQYLDYRDSLFKWFTVPYAQAYPHFKEANKQWSKFTSQQGLKSNVFFTILPALDRAFFLQIRLDRHIALLRTLEALRMYAANHGGGLPDSLAAIEAVPVPHDPVTGRSFIYNRRDAQHARLEAPICEQDSTRRPVYELTIPK